MVNRWAEASRAFLPAQVKPLPQTRQQELMSRCSIERIGALNVLYLSGTAYEIGYQHGMLARELIHRFRSEAYVYTASLVPLPKFLAKPALFYYAAAYWEKIPEEYRQEMQGLADGAGVHPVEALVATSFWEMLLMSGCSEFAAVAPYTPDGSLIHGYNYDLMHPDHALIQPYLAVLFYRPSQGIPFVTVNILGSIGVNAGINAAGISVAWDNTYLKDDELVKDVPLPVVPFVVTLRQLLQYAHNIDEAIRIVTHTLPRHLADIIIIGSAGESKAVALETAGSEYAIRPMVDGAIWSTNFFRSDKLAGYDRRGDWRTVPKNEEWNIFPRYTAYAQLFEASRGKLTPARAVDFLRDPYPREAQGFVHPNIGHRTTICRPMTSFSMVMEPGKQRLWVSEPTIPSAQGRFFAFDLQNWAHLEELDIAASGYLHALRCAETFVDGDYQTAREALMAARAADGETAPLLLMLAALEAMTGDVKKAEEILEKVCQNWPESIFGKMANSWLTLKEWEDIAAIPFPSAIKPLFFFKPGFSWESRIKQP